MVYEAMLLFGVIFIAGWLFSTVLQQRHALYLRHFMQHWIFFVVGVYFVWFWTHSGQTLAMKTWRIRLVTNDGKALNVKRAIGRYLLAWMWVFPGLVIAWSLGAKNALLLLIPLANIFLWSLTAFIDPQRQFLHDRIAGTRLICLKSIPSNGKK